MIDTFFMQVLDMTKAASIVILFVLAARLFLKKAPKVFSYALWGVVLFRLLCPFTLELPHSVVPEMQPISESYTLSDSAISLKDAGAAAQSAIGDALNGGLGVQHIPVHVSDSSDETKYTTSLWWEVWILLGQYIWLAGICGLLIYSLVSCLTLRQKLIGSVLLQNNIFLADHIDSPFVMGIIRPRIYLPSSLPHQEREYILLHEQHHIRRKDHLFKLLAFLALCLHWFNPLVWLAFFLSTRDMEMSCDEAVVKKLGENIRYDYSASLLRLATGRRIIAGTPLAFGEGDTKRRIKNMLSWKKPKVWLSVIAIILCIVVVASCIGTQKSESDQTNPGSQADQSTENTGLSDSQSAQPSGSAQATASTESQSQIAQSVTGAPALTEQGRIEDIAWHFELALSEKEFRNMSSDAKDSLLAEYGDLLNGYTLISREATDGSAAYIVGKFNGEPSQSPLHGMYSVEFNDQWGQLLYREEDSKAVEEALALWKEPTVGHSIKNSRISWDRDSARIFIQPNGIELGLEVVWNRYMHTPNGRAYIVDAISRGIDVSNRTNTFLYVYRITEEFGELAERIVLTENEANAILAEERVKITDGFGFSASLHMNGQTIYYNERDGIPQTVLDLAVKHCDYRFGDPSYITDTIREARLDCPWLEEPLYAKAEDLPRLREILKNSEKGYIGACGYGAVLKLTFTGGEKLTVFKGTDSCDSIAFGSYGGYFLGDKENTEFWNMFGLDAETKLPTGNN